jgi:hypothetical protein
MVMFHSYVNVYQRVPEFAGGGRSIFFFDEPKVEILGVVRDSICTFKR